jgi:hypothetical protein
MSEIGNLEKPIDADRQLDGAAKKGSRHAMKNQKSLCFSPRA